MGKWVQKNLLSERKFWIFFAGQVAGMYDRGSLHESFLLIYLNTCRYTINAIFGIGPISVIISSMIDSAFYRRRI